MPKAGVQPAHSVEVLQAEVLSLKAKFSDTQSTIPPEWGLSATEDKIFRVLLAVDIATREAIAVGAGREANRNIDVHIVRIRDKLTRFGIEIETVRLKGWRLVNRFSWSRALHPLAR